MIKGNFKIKIIIIISSYIGRMLFFYKQTLDFWSKNFKLFKCKKIYEMIYDREDN